MKWESVIGLEVHIQLSTKSKLFSGSSTQFGAEPNTQANVVDLAMPGVLPVLNREAVNMSIKFGLAVDAKINLTSIFARKNYFYPDLPKGYQISQYELPIVGKGYLDIFEKDGSSKRIGITRAHLEEDAGKSLHEDFQGFTGIDLNRAGTPLLEIVSEPELRSASEAVNYLKTLHSLVRYLGICDGNMQEGSFRCDANISIRRPHEPLGTRVEIKNLNSFRFIERAINYEIERQIEVIENGEKISQETRLYDANKNTTRVMRSKEDANDYRYFPDPDLLPLLVSEKTIEKIRAELPELPAQKRERFMAEYELSLYDTSILANHLDTANYFEVVLKESGVSPKLAANWVIVELASALNKLGLSIETSPVSATALALLLKRIKDETISGKIAKTVFEAMYKGEGSADEIIERDGLKQVTDSSAIEKIVDEVIANSPQQLTDYRAGKDRLFGYFVGQVMKASGGKVNPEQVNTLLKEKLK